LTLSAVSGWLKRFNNSGSFKASNNRTEEEKELIKLRKQNKQLLIENDILKQAALIMARIVSALNSSTVCGLGKSYSRVYANS